MRHTKAVGPERVIAGVGRGFGTVVIGAPHTLYSLTSKLPTEGTHNGHDWLYTAL